MDESWGLNLRRAVTYYPPQASGRSWLASMQGEADVESTLLWMMTLRTGLPLIDDTFEPWSLRRKKVMPIMTFAEMLGEME